MSHDRFCYLAGPIDQVSRDEAREWRSDMAGRLNYRGFHTYDPAAAFHCTHVDRATAMVIDVVNREALRQCGIVIAKIAPDQLAFGTIREIEYAVMAGKEVWLIAPHLVDSFATYDLHLCTSTDDLTRRFDLAHALPGKVIGIALDNGSGHVVAPAICPRPRSPGRWRRV